MDANRAKLYIAALTAVASIATAFAGGKATGASAEGARLGQGAGVAKARVPEAPPAAATPSPMRTPAPSPPPFALPPGRRVDPTMLLDMVAVANGWKGQDK